MCRWRWNLKHPDLFQGTYVYQDCEITYWTKCPYCPNLATCKKRRAPVEGCETVGWVRFLVGGVGKVRWSGVIELKKIDGIVKDYLETDPPEDVAMPLRQMRLEGL